MACRGDESDQQRKARCAGSACSGIWRRTIGERRDVGGSEVPMPPRQQWRQGCRCRRGCVWDDGREGGLGSRQFGELSRSGGVAVQLRPVVIGLAQSVECEHCQHAGEEKHAKPHARDCRAAARRASRGAWPPLVACLMDQRSSEVTRRGLRDSRRSTPSIVDRRDVASGPPTRRALPERYNRHVGPTMAVTCSCYAAPR